MARQVPGRHWTTFSEMERMISSAAGSFSDNLYAESKASAIFKLTVTKLLRVKDWAEYRYCFFGFLILDIR